MKHFIKPQVKTVLLILLFPLLSFGQNFEIKGQIIEDIQNTALPFVNVVLKSSDNTILNGVTTDENGNFVIESEAGQFNLEISFLGYNSKTISLSVSENKDLGVIVLEEAIEQLEGVSIIAKKPTIKKEAGVLTMNVENSSISEIGNASDILRQTPSLSVSSENAIQVFGKGQAQIYIDGRRVEDASELNLINSSDVSKVEVIRNPSAKYDAEGNAIVLITTTKNKKEGFNSKLTFRYDQRTLSSWLGGLNLNYKKGGVNLYSSYSYGPKQRRSIDEYQRTFFNDDLTETTMRNIVENTSDFKNVHNVRLGSSIDIGTNQTLDIKLSSAIEGDDLDANNTNQVINLNNQDLQLNTFTSTEVSSQTNSVNVNYENRIDTLGRRFNFFSNYTRFESSSKGGILEDISNLTADRNKENNNENNIDILTTAIDYSHPFGESLMVDVGAKYSKVLNSSDLRLSNITEQTIIEREGFKYDETIYAVYGEIRKNFEKLRAKLGVRVENTDLSGVSRVTDETIIDSSFTNVFPSVSLNYKMSEDLGLGFYYSKRIARPDIQSLNPFVNFIDSLSIQRGNPRLRPVQTDEFELSIEYQEAISLDISYNKFKRPIYDFLTNEDFVTVATEINFESEEQFSVGLGAPYDLDWWTIYAYGGVSHVFNTTVIDDQKLKDNTYFEFLLQSSFNLPAKFDVNLSYLYSGEQRDGIFTIQPLQILNISVGKKMFNDQLSLRLNAQDIFDTYRVQSNTSLEGFDIQADQFFDISAFIFSAVYTFGNNNNKKIKDKEVPELDRIKKDN